MSQTAGGVFIKFSPLEIQVAMTHNDKVMLITFGLVAVCFGLFVCILLCERKKRKKAHIAQKERRLNWILSLNFPYKVHYLEKEWDELKEIFTSK